MEFFDCNMTYGANTGAEVFQPAETVEALRAHMRRAGIARAVVNRTEQLTSSTLTANELLAEDLAEHEELYGVWGIVPSHTHELPPPEEVLQAMRPRRIIGWRLLPARSRFLVKEFVLRDWLESAVAHRVPIFINTGHGTTLEALADLLERVPELTVVLTYQATWPSDRLFRPFVAEFPNVYLDLTDLITDGGIESFVEEYGASRLLFGSGFPASYPGANMLMVKHAEIPEEDRAAIAGANMQRLIEEIML